jgi:DNA helicase II / ATP-dependent DNA helicase PcrA
MEKIIKKRKKVSNKLKKYQSKIHDLEYQLIELERQSNEIDQKEIIKQMNLNEQQDKIVMAEQNNENILVLACPGSGKTHTLISRYINLVTNHPSGDNIDPDSIIMITFTKKAGMEMENRLKNLIPTKLPHYVGSLHGLGYRLLQRFNKINYTVLDDKDSKYLLKDVVDSTISIDNIDDEDISVIKSKIGIVIDQASTSYPVDFNTVVDKLNLNNYLSIFKKIFRNYNSTKKKQNLVDFNDLMILFANFLKTKKAIPFLESINYVFFDEYQDINPIQNFILSKFKDKSNIMVVGDDAQSIYKFRGSNIKYIWNFKNEYIPNKTYYLEANYRSTNEIVDFCQDIIKNNSNQFDKKVKAVDMKSNTKPHILAFKDVNCIEQYKWIAEDIKKRHASGIPYKDMVILARKNSLLDKIEYQLLSHKIPTLKHLGLSLLDKNYIKDFLSFLVILINKKTSVHWKRILALHPSIGVVKANEIIEFNPDIRESIKVLVEQSKFYKKYLGDFNDILNLIDNENIIMSKIRIIILYLQDLWKMNKSMYRSSNIDKMVDDTRILLNYINNKSSLEDFVNDLYLNKEVDQDFEDSVYLTTVHGSKGLEWEYVYIIDMDNKNFPAIMPKFFIDELDEMEEERRLFYVAASRAKSQLVITYNMDLHPERLTCMSPLLKEVNTDLYIPYGLENEEFMITGYVSKDVTNYLRFKGFKNVRPMLSDLPFEIKGFNKQINSIGLLQQLSRNYANRIALGNFLDYIIAKMMYVNFPDLVKKFDLNLIHRYSTFLNSANNKKIYHNYVDKLSDWKDIIEDIYYISTYKHREPSNELKEFILSSEFYYFLKNLEKGIVSYFSNDKNNNLPSKYIHTHYNITFDIIKGELDLLIDDHLIEIKSSLYQTTTLSNLSQTLIYGYLVEKKDMKVNKVSILNPLLGTIVTFDTNEFDFKKFILTVYKG